jgi:hypothetical protein
MYAGFRGFLKRRDSARSPADSRPAVCWFYVKDGKLTYIYNFLGLEKFLIPSTQAVPSGKHQLRMEFAYDGGGLAKGATVTLFIDGKAVGEGRVDRTVPAVFSADETSDVGIKRGSPITPDMPAQKSAFNGSIEVVVIETSGEDTDHLLNREEIMNMIMARQ